MSEKIFTWSGVYFISELHTDTSLSESHVGRGGGHGLGGGRGHRELFGQDGMLISDVIMVILAGERG
jgi:hypothetical protein